MKTSSESLEFSVIRERIQECALSREGRERVASCRSFTDADVLDAELDVMEFAASLMRVQDSSQVSSFPEIASSVRKLAREHTLLDGDELYSIALYAKAAFSLYSYFTEMPPGFSAEVRSPGEGPDKALGPLARRITSELEPPGSVRQNHPRIVPLVRQLEQYKRERGEVSLRFLRSDQGIWQQDTPTIRDGRVVLPLKSAHRSRVSGFVQGISATGGTLFVEPSQLMDANNQVFIQEQRISAEITAILRDLTQEAWKLHNELEHMLHAVARLDQVYAFARFSLLYGCSRPSVGGVHLNLIQARHPLLGKAAVPIDITIPSDRRAVIMTGPNAGGKTVTVKTVGLLSLMAGHGMLIPASSQSTVPLFSTIHADIGDDQSISESLSTFSGHMVKIASIVSEADQSSLVILDELASGTDTREGAALAKSIILHCLEIGCLTLVTSHHMTLKQFGYADSRVVNAAMEFDQEQSRPTYRILFGVPGNSYALETAQRMGLPSSVVSLAREFMLEEGDTSEMILRRLEEREIELRKQEEAMQELRRELTEASRKLQLEDLKIRQRERLVRQRDFSTLGRFIEDSSSRLENLIRDLREGEITQEKIRRAREYREELEQKHIEAGEKLRREEQSLAQRREVDFRPGMRVRTASGVEGVIKRKGKKAGHWYVEVGNLHADMNQNDLTPIAGDANSFYDTKPLIDVSFERGGNAAGYELDIRGEQLASARTLVERHIDQAVLNGFEFVSIIHGKGEGILQRGMHEFLSDHPSVRDYQFAPPETGGYGRTVVRLRT